MKLVGLPIKLLHLPSHGGGLGDPICPMREAQFPGPAVSEMGTGFKTANQRTRTKEVGRMRGMLYFKKTKPEKVKLGALHNCFSTKWKG